MLISRVHFPVHTLGWGRRVGIWTQGCTIGCVGCMSRDTWDADPGADVPVDEVLRIVEQCGAVDGVTISGGEPLEQPEELEDLLIRLRSMLGDTGDILCYSGRGRRVVETAYAHLLARVDAMVVGPFIQRKACDDALRGSSNQEILCLTALGRERYADGRLRRGAHLSVGVDDHELRLIGVPAPGDMTALETVVTASGLALVDASWADGGASR